MGKACSSRSFLKASLAALLVSLMAGAVFQGIVPDALPHVHAQDTLSPGSIAPSTSWGALGRQASGDVQIDIVKPGIAVRVEVPQEFGGISSENDTSSIESNIRNDYPNETNDYYYYSVVDERDHWTYAWHGMPSDGPCFKPNFSLRDPNAPWCVEIWNYVNGTFLTFSAPKFIRFHDLQAPSIAGMYNFTLFVANKTNSIGNPDFVHAWNKTLFVPVSMSDDPASISGVICDGGGGGNTPTCPLLGTKGVAYAQTGGQVVARAFVNETTGRFRLTGLAAASNGTTYQVLASAGFSATYQVAYSLTTAINGPVTVYTGKDSPIDIKVDLLRAPQLCGEIDYVGSNWHSLSSNSFLVLAGLKVLNITVEATDNLGHTFRNQTISSDGSFDRFRIMTGSNRTYVGTDPYGTEFAGLPPGDGLTLKVWISGYVQCAPGDTVCNVPSSGYYKSYDQSKPTPCILNLPDLTITMHMGGAISGTIQFFKSLNPLSTESPQKAEEYISSLSGFPVTGALFGGNVVVEAYNSSDALSAVEVINGTNPDGTTKNRDKTSIPFILFGFSEYLNRTRSGVWGDISPIYGRDYGLPPGQYHIRVYIRGYELDTTITTSWQQSLSSTGACACNVTLNMVRGGVFKVIVSSYDNRFGSRATQSLLPFRFLNLSIPVRARVYFKNPVVYIGYVECILRTKVVQPDKLCMMGTGRPGSDVNSVTVIFAGQNWSLRDIIWFSGYFPTHIKTDMYTIEPYTLGYVWQYSPVSYQNGVSQYVPTAVPLLIGDGVDITGRINVNLNTLGPVPYNDSAIGETLRNGVVAGAVPVNLFGPIRGNLGNTTLLLPIFGFGGMATNTGKLEGQGHFFYISPAVGDQNCEIYPLSCNPDYGLDNATYTPRIPEFGYTLSSSQPGRFMQLTSPDDITFSDLFQERGVGIDEIAMAIVVSGSLVTGWAYSSCSGNPASCDVVEPLTWVRVTASNSTFNSCSNPESCVTTLDGQYGGVNLPDGVGALNLPQGTYSFTFSVPFYESTNVTNVQGLLTVYWGQGPYPVHPLNPLCPIAAGTCDPPTTLTLAQFQTPFSTLVLPMFACIPRRPTPSPF